MSREWGPCIPALLEAIFNRWRRPGNHSGCELLGSLLAMPLV
jgi:hypothetical protein